MTKFNKVIGETSKPETVVSVPVSKQTRAEPVPEKPQQVTKEVFNEEEVFAETADKDFFDNMTIEE